MKNKALFINICAISVLILCSNVNAQQTWQLYDDFSSGTIDLNKWYIDDSSATITIENGRAKFVHLAGHGSDSSWLGPSNIKQQIYGLKATITVESCSADNDVRVRIGGWIGTIGSDLAWSDQSIRAYQQYISAAIAIEGLAPSYEYKYDYFWGHYKSPMDIIGIPFTLSTIVSSSDARYIVDGLGELEYSLPSALGPVAEDQSFFGIGTRSNNGTGTCTAYFDDVYILVDEPVIIVPATYLLLKDKKK